MPDYCVLVTCLHCKVECSHSLDSPCAVWCKDNLEMRECVRDLVKTQTDIKTNVNLSRTSSNRHAMSFMPLPHTYTQMYGACSTAGSVLVRIWSSRQVAVGPVVFVGPVGGAAVVLLIGRRAVVFVGAGLYVAAVVFRHLRGVNTCVITSGRTRWCCASSRLGRLTCNGFHFPTWEVADEHEEEVKGQNSSVCNNDAEKKYTE